MPETYSFERYFGLLDHLKSKTLCAGQPWWPTQSAPLFKISESAPEEHLSYRKVAGGK